MVFGISPVEGSHLSERVWPKPATPFVPRAVCCILIINPQEGFLNPLEGFLNPQEGFGKLQEVDPPMRRPVSQMCLDPQVPSTQIRGFLVPLENRIIMFANRYVSTPSMLCLIQTNPYRFMVYRNAFQVCNRCVRVLSSKVRQLGGHASVAVFRFPQTKGGLYCKRVYSNLIDMTRVDGQRVFATDNTGERKSNTLQYERDTRKRPTDIERRRNKHLTSNTGKE